MDLGHEWVITHQSGCNYTSMSYMQSYPDSKVHGANMGLTWVLSAPDGPHVGLMNLAIKVDSFMERNPRISRLIASIPLPQTDCHVPTHINHSNRHGHYLS